MKKMDSSISYKERIDEWISTVNNITDKIDLKKVYKSKIKNIKRDIECNNDPLIVNNKYVIKGVYIHRDLWMYYNSPKEYFSDLFMLIKKMRSYIHNKTSYVTFTYPDDNKIHQLSLIHFIYNMIIWMPFFILDIPINKEKTFVPEVFNNDEYVKFINTKIISPFRPLVTHNEMSKILSKMYDMFIFIAERYSLDLGLSFSLYDLISKWDNDEIYDLNHTKIPKQMQISESENYLNERLHRYKEIMLDDPNDNVLKPLLRSGKGVNNKQLREFTISTGFKPHIGNENKTIQIKPKSSFISDGIRNITDFVVDANGGRYAAILALQIDNSGYLARECSKLASNLVLNDDPNYICDTKHYYHCTITDKTVLKDMRGRWYVNDNDELVQLLDTDYDMIGKTLRFRSPVTCASKNGICSVCYGHLYSQNKGINIGINSTLKESERAYQNLMSAKHALDTKSDTISFVNKFYYYFILVDGFRVKLREDIEDVENIKNIFLRFNIYQIKKKKNIDDMYGNEYVDSFYVHNKSNDSIIEIYDEADNDLYIGKDILKIIAEKRNKLQYDKEGWIEIPISDIMKSENDCFFIQVKSKTIADSLNNMKSLIEKGSEIEEVESISDLITKVHTFLKNGGVRAESVHTEILVRNMVRDRNDIIHVPDYSKEKIDYVITSINRGIQRSDSVITGLTFEKIKEQFKNPITYKKRGRSPMDVLYIP